MSRIRFGPEGWKAVLAEEFTFANVKALTQGIAAYLNSNNLGKKGVVVGYDSRFLGDKIARAVARVLVANGIKVFLLRRPVPTPVVAFAVRERATGGALVVAGGSCPYEYQGLKFIPEYAGAAMPAVAEEIQAETDRVLECRKVYELSLEEGGKLGLVEEIEVENDYLRHLSRMVNPEIFKERQLKVVVDPMFGAAVGCLDRCLEAFGCEVRVVHGYRDVLFGGLRPEPVDTSLDDLKRAVRAYEADLGLALDGEGGRLGVVDETGEFLTPNRVLCLVLDHLLKTRSFRGPVARTAATTRVLDRIAKKNGLGVNETPLGFHYIGECLRERGCMLGGDEEGGLSVLGHVPCKDGILAGLLVAEMVAFAQKSLSEIYGQFTEEYGRTENQRLDFCYREQDRERVTARLQEFSPKAIAGVKVEKTLSVEGKKFVMEDGSWVLVRNPETQPVVTVYIEAQDRVRLADIQREIQNALGLSSQ
ncbi:MAG: phosphoglucomutase/phosphomannomutase family protein [Syntrophothermus sp.]|uniref:phosphoglucomutase/phosphomannomutase family protein n=1 Tax=Syntrophothermus sp. TaxID=2736299 RepID=UPI002579A608|nr:phosphoglucomutase/phosphomannomutase family protein [Syntrophothermus sp.]NSW83238.1 phosphoglucomutase/phosphomannomutase family protein [Syntrophothermus sp.]